jgi:hypothetical protein
MDSLMKHIQQLTYLGCGVGYNYNSDVHNKLDHNVCDN